MGYNSFFGSILLAPKCVHLVRLFTPAPVTLDKLKVNYVRCD
jgi:hypothetical protein